MFHVVYITGPTSSALGRTKEDVKAAKSQKPENVKQFGLNVCRHKNRLYWA
jgi:hypothetical protein